MGDSRALLQDAHRFGPATPDEEYVHGSCAPGWHSAAKQEVCLEQWVEEMQSAGIERVCCLVAASENELRELYAGRCREAFGQDGFLHAPIPPSRLASPELLNSEILPFLDASKESEEQVVVHCLSGLGRTGQVLAAWLAYDRGYEPQRAVGAVRQAGRDPSDAIRQGNATKSELFELIEAVRDSEY